MVGAIAAYNDSVWFLYKDGATVAYNVVYNTRVLLLLVLLLFVFVGAIAAYITFIQVWRGRLL